MKQFATIAWLAASASMLAMVAGLYVHAGRRATLFESGTRTVGRVERVNAGVRFSGIDYAFSAGGSAVAARRGVVFDACVKNYAVGDAIDVWYNPLDPTNAVSEAERCYVTRGWKVYAAFLLLGAMLTAGFAVRRFRRR